MTKTDYNENYSMINPQKRFFLFILLIIVFVIYSLYLSYLQLVRGAEYKVKAVSISRQMEILPSQRGEIYDRNNSIPLVLNIDSFAVMIVPAEIPASLKETVFTKLAVLLEISIDDITKKIPPAFYKFYQPIEISNSVNQEIINSIAERIDEFPGVVWYSKPKRNYLETGSFSHLIGYVGEISNDELKYLYNKGYQNGDIIGKSGVERQYDLYLKGKDGKQFKTVDVRGRKIELSGRDIEPPEMGKNVILTIDRNLQLTAEKALGKRIGSIVVLKPATGEILAMASWPSYNANSIIAKGGNNEYSKLLNDSQTPLINRAIQSSYPIASTFKTVMTVAILEEKAISVEEKVLCVGEINYGERVFRCWIRKPGHGRLNLKEALAQSCDVYFWEIGRDKLGIERIVSYAKEFGYGQLTSVDLPGEAIGFVPTPQWKERRFNEKWLGGDTLNLSIGQGYFLATPLQVANMFSMVINEGTIFKPHILKELRDSQSGVILQKIVPEILISSSISKAAFKTTKENLRYVITDGTAKYPVSTKAVKIAGKTGTAEVNSIDHWHSWFVGYGPWDYQSVDDVIVVVAMIEAANTWEWWAPYATNIIFDSYFANRTYEETITELGLEKKQMVPSERLE